MQSARLVDAVATAWVVTATVISSNYAFSECFGYGHNASCDFCELPPPERPLDKSEAKGGEAEKKEKAATENPIHQNLKGMITPDCLADHCWFCCGCKSDVPKDCKCLLVGHYCDTYVWVPSSGRDELSKLTLLILDIAYYNPPQVKQTGGYASNGEATEYYRTPTSFPFSTIFEAQTLQNFAPQQTMAAPTR